jgi:hypothetical protein
MSQRYLASMGTLAVVIAMVALVWVPVAGQASTAAAKAKTTVAAKASAPPRTPWGAPDLQGVWDNHTITPLERPDNQAGREFLTEQEVAELEQQRLENGNQDRRDGAGTEADVGRAYNEFWWDRATKVIGNRRTSLVVDPPDGKIPALTPEAQSRAAATAGRGGGGGRADSWEDRGLWERCITRTLPRLPGGGYNPNYQIVQGPNSVAILNEMIHETRIIPLDGSPHLPQGIRQWQGDPRGHWEGNTLVVDTTNFSDRVNFRGSSATLHLIERFTRVDADTLLYELTVDDPTTWTKPWTISFPTPKSQGQVYEYACHEGNYGMFGILSGARAQEKAAAEAAKKGSR